MSFAAMVDGRPPTLVVGLGNPILGDDGVGWRIADALERRLSLDSATRDAIGAVEVDRVAVGGLSLMERLVGYERAVLADAVIDGRPTGSVRLGGWAELVDRRSEHLDSAHDVTLSRALDLAAALGAELPADIRVVTVSVAGLGEFAESLSPTVQAAVEPAVDRILDLLVASVGAA